MISESMRLTIEQIVAGEAAGRWVAAAMRLALLREEYEAFDVETMAPDEQSWEAFAAKYVPLPSHRVHDLIGRMVHGGGMLRCSCCDAKVKSACHCGAVYVGEHRWADPAPVEPAKKTAVELAMAAILTAPEASNRAIAAQIHVSDYTVRKARERLAPKPADHAPTTHPADKGQSQ